MRAVIISINIFERVVKRELNYKYSIDFIHLLISN
jgi:hypothetical protein